MSHPHPSAAGRRTGTTTRPGSSVPASEFGAALRRPAGLDGCDPDDRVDPADPIDPRPPAWRGAPTTW